MATALLLALAALLAAAVRALFLPAGVGPDEAGYAYVAREWARGASLYADVWIDRPQGLIAAYRALLALGLGDPPWLVRTGAVVAGPAIAVLVGIVAWLLHGPRAAVAAAALYAIAGVGPRTEGFTFNGELAAAAPASAAVACAVAWLRRGGMAWLAAGGALGAGAMLMKQSGFDGLLVVLAAAVLATGSAGARARRLAVVTAAAAAPLGAAAVHGIREAGDAWWHALVAYRVGDGGPLPAHASRGEALNASIGAAAADLLPLALCAAAGIAFAVSRKAGMHDRAADVRRGGGWLPVKDARLAMLLPVAWLAAALVGFNVGGAYWAHYYVQLVPPLCLLAALAAASLRTVRLGATVVAICMLPALAWLAPFLAEPAGERSHRVAYNGMYRTDVHVARYLQQHTRPDEPVYVFYSRATVYFLADRRSPYPYLWGYPIRTIPGSVDRLRATLEGPGRPTLVALYAPPTELDPGGGLAHVLRERYEEVWRSPDGDVPVLRARSRARAPLSTAG